MGKTMYFLLGLLFLILVGFLWRVFSCKRALPCPTWLGWLVELDNPFAKVHRASEIISHLDLVSGMKVLDAGCGPGRVTIPIAKKIGAEGRVTAMDLQSGMLEKVREKAEKENISNISFIHGGLGEGRLEKAQYDRALLVAVLGEIVDKKSALRELFEALKPGGVLSVTEIIFDPHFQRKKVVLQLACDAGFRWKKTVGNFLAYNMLLEKPLNR